MSNRQSIEAMQGWHSQYERLIRWQLRVRAIASGKIENATLADVIDFTIVSFQCCYHLRDWLVKDGATTQQQLDALFAANKELQICRDICNGTKPLEITHPSVDARFSIRRGYVRSGWSSGYAFQNTKLMIVVDGMNLNLVELADSCLKIWQKFLFSQGLLSSDPSST